MSSEDFTKKLEDIRKQINILRKDINYRDEQGKRGDATYSLDAEIRGQFIQINQLIETAGNQVKSYQSAPKDFNITKGEADKRAKAFDQIVTDKNNLQKAYDALFGQNNSPKKALIVDENADEKHFDKKYDTKTLTTKQLADIKKKQQDEHDQALDELIGVVKQVRVGAQTTSKQLNQHDKLLNVLEDKMDDNIGGISKTRRNMMKLLDSSSNCCLMTVVILEIIAVVALLII